MVKQAAAQTWSLQQYLSYWHAHAQQAVQPAGPEQVPQAVGGLDEAQSRVQQRWAWPRAASLILGACRPGACWACRLSSRLVVLMPLEILLLAEAQHLDQGLAPAASLQH